MRFCVGCPHSSHQLLLVSDRRTQRHRHRLQCRRALGKTPNDSEPGGQPSSQGDPNVQNTLVDILRVQINQKEVEEYTEEQKGKLIQAADTLKEEVDRVSQQTTELSDEAFASAMEDINRKADEFEDELRRSRQQLEADAIEFRQWQRKMAAERSRGQFFKTLYQADETPLVGEDAKMLKAQAEEAAAQGMQMELSSGRRVLLFTFLTAVLLLVAAADAVSENPSWPQIVLYTLLAGTFGGITWAEKRFLASWQANSGSKPDVTRQEK